MAKDLSVLDGEVLIEEARTLNARWRVRTASGSDASALSCELVLRDFRQAFALMTEVAMLAERADHHPEWSNVYNRINIVLTTHDAGGVTVKDMELARQIDVAVAGYISEK